MNDRFPWTRALQRLGPVAALALALTAGGAAAQLLPMPPGARELPGRDGDGPVTVFAPDSGADGTAGNGRLVVLSHGSGGNPRVHADLIRALRAAGYTVAMPEHRADNTRDPSNPGPDSWKRRPAEVSRAIDAVAADPALAAQLHLDRVGMYGMSAGGHTALSLAGGAWSPALFRQHCDEDLDADFQSCVGLITRLKGNALDGFKRWFARRVIAWRFSDETRYAHADQRIAAVAAAVPAAADFDVATLATPHVPLALLTAGRDAWLVPRFHSDRVLAACLPRCEHLADLPEGGHGAYLSPLPPGLDGLIGDMLNDPPGFDRSALPAVDARIVDFFDRHLRASEAGPLAQSTSRMR
jgi:predicted dienelactone hydrolase